MSDAVSSRAALVTGSGRDRVGRVVARSLARRGFNIGIHYHRSADEAEQAVAEMRSLGAKCEAFRADVGNEREVEQMFRQAVECFGRLDVLVTTASIWKPGHLEQTTAEDVERNFRVNTLGTFLCARRAGLIMCDQPEGGTIITIGDWALARPYPDHAAYFISKGAIPTLTRTLAVELAQRNPRVRVNCIHPGPVMFPPDATEEERQDRINSTLVKQANCPESVSQAVQFLIENEFVTGACIPVEGGRTIFAQETGAGE